MKGDIVITVLQNKAGFTLVLSADKTGEGNWWYRAGEGTWLSRLQVHLHQ
jgi:hypothetical protein